MCYLDSDDTASVWRVEQRRAKKLHRCDTCSADIAVGEHYVSVFYVYDGSPAAEKSCGSCWEANTAFAQAHDFSGMPPDEFEHMLADCIAEGDEESEQKWKPMLEAIRVRRSIAKQSVHQ